MKKNTCCSRVLENRAFRRSPVLLVSSLIFALSSQPLWAKGAVTSITTSTLPATPTEYVLEDHTYRFGQGENLVIDTFNYNGVDYDFLRLGTSVEVRRVDIPGVSEGTPCGLFAANTGIPFSYQPDYPDDGSGTGNCDVSLLMGGRIINRGALDVFSNFGYTTKNIERIDFIFSHGIVSPLNGSLLSQTGHIATEKRGNNMVKLAAITALDSSGNPSAYGPLVTVHAVGCTGDTICYGETQVINDNGFLHNPPMPPQGYVNRTNTNENEYMAIAFVSLQDLGIGAGQRYFGFSYFGRDVDASLHDLVNPETFPQTTGDNSNGDSADVYGGTSGYFINSGINALMGRAFRDDNGNDVLDDGEPGLPSLSVVLHADTNGNGIYDAGIDLAAGAAAETIDDGHYYYSGMPNGTYFARIDISDSDIPAGYAFSGDEEAIKVSFNNNEITDINFPFYPNDTDGTDGTDNGTVDPGATPTTGIPRTGLEGHGAGSLGLGGLISLMGLGLWRRFPRKALSAAIALPLLGIQSASAETSPAARDFDQRLYIGGGASSSQLEPDPGNPANTLTDDSSNGGLVYLGYDLGKRLSVEGFYTDLGSAQMSIGGALPADLDYSLYGISAIGYLLNSRNASDYADGWDDEGLYRREGWSLIGRVGLGRLENSASFRYEKEYATDLHFGAGVEYGFRNGFAVRAEAVSYDEDVKAVHLSLLKRFGEPTPYVVAKLEPEPIPEPAPEPQVQPVLLSLPSAHFAFDSALLTDKGVDALTVFAEQLKQSAETNIRIEGNTCSVGPEVYNQGLSERRAASVRDFLQSQGIANERMVTIGYGETRPKADNATRQGREENRRVDIIKNN